MRRESRTLFIVGCSKKKLSNSAPVKDFYQGQLFKMVKKLVTQNNFDYRVLSGKFGLWRPDEMVSPYDQKIESSEESIKTIRDLTLPRLSKILAEYDSIILIMGKTYRKVIEPLISQKFIVIFDKRGILGYLSIISKYLKLPKARLLKELERFRIQENNNNIGIYNDINKITIEKWINK